MRRGEPAWQDGAWAETVEARSGRAFLEVDRGPDCAPSLLVLQRLPGYTERDHVQQVALSIPTCAASRSTLVDIPAGPFYRNVDTADGAATRDELADLPAYAIDRTEVTRAAFEMYGRMKAHTGDDAAPSTFLAHRVAPTSDLPVVGINYLTARSYCRYHGKSLPDVDRWQKAFRGGLALYSAGDPRALRATVWFAAKTPHPTNLAYAYPADGLIAPVGAFPDDASPYGVLDLAGNVSEWSDTLVTASPYEGLRFVLGANWGSPPNLGHERITWRNSRPDQTIDFGIGVRCVAATRSD